VPLGSQGVFILIRHRLAGSAAPFQKKIGLGSEIGALLAGICLASQPYAQEISRSPAPAA